MGPENAALSRRKFLAASGATLAVAPPLVLAACGTDEEDEATTPERQVELLNAVLAQQRGVIAAVDPASSNAPEELQESFDWLNTIRQQSSRALRASIADLEGTPTDAAAELVGGESPTEGVAAQLEASIAASLDVIGDLESERRKPVHIAITQDAAVLAAIRSTLGEKPAPDAFVFGPPVAEVRA